MRSVSTLLLTSLVLVASGCGLSDYEAEMARTRERIAILDEENELLADAVRLPSDAPPVYFRPPKGVNPQFATPPSGEKPPAESKWLFRFPWNDAKLRMPLLEVWIAVRLGSEQGTLEEKVIQYFWEKTGMALGAASPPRGSYLRKSDPPQTRRPVAYRRLTLANPEKPALPNEGPLPESFVYNHDVYVHESGGVAIVLKHLDVAATKERWKELAPEKVQRLAPLDEAENQQKLARLPKQMQLSLATLVVGTDAEARLQLLKK